MPRRLIDEIVFQAAALAPITQRPSTHSLNVMLPVAANGKGFVQAVPFFARRPPVKADQTNWPIYCGLLKSLGIPLHTDVAALERLPVASVPHRFACRCFDQGFQAIEIQTAEAIEIRCIANRSGTPLAQLPIEVFTWEELRVQVECLRELTGARTPIGLGMLIGDISADVANAIAAHVDFIILEASSTDHEIDCDITAWAIAAARRECFRANKPSFPIFLDAPIARSEDLIKLLALGASALSIDALTAEAVPPIAAQPTSAAKSMLSGIGGLPVSTPPTLTTLEIRLRELIEKLITRLHVQNLSHVNELNATHLRAVSNRAAQIGGLTPLWDAGAGE